jgi:hypothetical protein
MKQMKATLRRLWHLTRATSIAVSLAVVVALVGGVVSGAVAATPTTTTATAILKGVSNTANAVTTLINSGTGAALDLQVQLPDPDAASPAPPLTVNSDTKVANLNADSVDGMDLKSAAVAKDGTLLRGKGAVSAQGLGGACAGCGANEHTIFEVVFDTEVLQCVPVASIGGSESGQVSTEHHPTNPNALVIHTSLNHPFNVQVVC